MPAEKTNASRSPVLGVVEPLANSRPLYGFARLRQVVAELEADRRPRLRFTIIQGGREDDDG